MWMKVCVISEDQLLARTVRDAARGLPVEQRFNSKFGKAPLESADLYVWDFEPHDPLPRRLRRACDPANIFLVRREHLAQFHSRSFSGPVSVLLKPASRSGLRPVLERAAERWRACHRGAAPPPKDPRRADRYALLQCLLAAGSRLQHHQVERTNFLDRAVDDFRAPLMAAEGYCGLLAHQQLGTLNSGQLDALKRIQHSLVRIDTLVRTMLQLSAGQPDGLKPLLQPNDIEQCVERAVDAVTPTADMRDLQINVQLSRPPRFVFDALQIEQVLINLLENACRFAPSHSSIEVKGYPVWWTGLENSVPRQGPRNGAGNSFALCNAYRMDVSDGGREIPPEHLQDIFEQYVSSSGGQDRSGTGLGLATCKMIVAAHHGEVFADSQNGGATFSFVLPLAQTETRNELQPAAPCPGAGPALDPDSEANDWKNDNHCGR